MSQVLAHPYFKGFKFEPKKEEEERVSPFEKIVREESPARPTNQLSDHEFDALLNGLSVGGSSEKTDSKRYQNEKEEVEKPKLKLVESIQPNLPGLSPAKEPTFGKQSRPEQEGDYSYGSYLPSFGGTNNQSTRNKKGSLGLFALESMNKR